MSYKKITTEMDESLLIVRLNWPDKRNALDLEMRSELWECVCDAELDSNVKSLLFIGEGEKAFSAGTNIPELKKRTLSSEMGTEASLRKELPTKIERLSKPCVAAINGYCLGGGLELALGCTIRIASDNALMGLPEITLGQIPGSGGTQRLYRYVGLGWAMQLILTGEIISADKACAIGLITEVVSREFLFEKGVSLAKNLGSKAPIAFVAARDAVLRSTEIDLLNGIDYERKLYAICMGTNDSQEGLKAFDEKRDPNYEGN